MSSIAPTSSATPPPELTTSERASGAPPDPVEARISRRDTALISDEARALLAAEQSPAPDV
jgi:hypothetical protein